MKSLSITYFLVLCASLPAYADYMSCASLAEIRPYVVSNLSVQYNLKVTSAIAGDLFYSASPTAIDFIGFLPYYLQVSRVIGIPTSKEKNICMTVWVNIMDTPDGCIVADVQTNLSGRDDQELSECPALSKTVQ